jgi:hypothetical protein
MTEPVNINGRWWIYDAESRTHKPASGEPVAARTKGSKDMAAVPASAEQRTKRKESVRRRKGCTISQRVDIEVRTYRVHTCDTEAVFFKHALDAIVERGVISDDSAKEVASIKYYAAEKVETYEEEGHLITIIPCSESIE